MSSAEITVIDTHVHLFPSKEVGQRVLDGVKRTFGTSYYCTGSPEELAETMQAAGISHAVILNQAAASKEAMNWLLSGNFFVCAYSKKRPGLIPAIGLDKGMKRSPAAEIEHKLKWGARAVKLHPVAQKFHVNDREMWPIYQKCAETSLPIIFHCGKMMIKRMVNYAHPRLFHDVLKSFPTLMVVLAHMGGGFWEDATRLANAFPENVYLDTAIALSAAPIPDFFRLSDDQAVAMIRQIGPHRIMFGSDFPWINPKPDIARIRGLPLTDEEKRMILGENARAFFNI
ncbi:amidohydrolase family protein [Chloroflexota bacterium]